jgi:hypothetical protein
MDSLSKELQVGEPGWEGYMIRLRSGILYFVRSDNLDVFLEEHHGDF